MDKITVQRRSWNMSRIKGTNTKPEIIIRKLLFKNGFRYRLHYKITGKPDIVFPKKKIAIFIHGCFWHQHTCNNANIPKTNTEFWKNKLVKNKERDKKVLDKINYEGWKVKTIWECEIENSPENTIKKLINFIHM